MVQDAGFDVVFAGGGLAASVTALRLASLPDAPRVLLVDPSDAPLDGHTWSFHEHDFTVEPWLVPAIAHRWNGQQVRFPAASRTLRSGYATITPESLGAAVDAAGIARHRARVTDIAPDRVTLDGTEIRATAIDARGLAPHPALTAGFQKFVGHEVELEAPHGLTLPIIMDATVAQLDGYRFLYTLPLSPTRLLIEDTRYADTPDPFDADIEGYAQTRGWQIDRTIRKETGALPITLAFDAPAFWKDAKVARIGLAAGQFHPVTGYSLPYAVRTSAIVARHWRDPAALLSAIRSDALARAKEQAFYRMLNRMLFRAADPDQRWRVLQRFYTLPEPLIERFYAGATTPADMARILIGKPPVPLSRAIRALPERGLNV